MRRWLYEALVSDHDVDVVYIATPNRAHKDNILLCLNHGKSLLCEKPFTSEKPFTMNCHETAEVIRVAREKKSFSDVRHVDALFPGLPTSS
ncbi:MAG: Gfo/Idh/MocA family oxidoreductase [Symbiopectobacterium sp.]